MRLLVLITACVSLVWAAQEDSCSANGKQCNYEKQCCRRDGGVSCQRLRRRGQKCEHNKTDEQQNYYLFSCPCKDGLVCVDTVRNEDYIGLTCQPCEDLETSISGGSCSDQMLRK